MTDRARHLELPRTDDLVSPPGLLLTALGGAARSACRRRFDLDEAGRENFPRRGPVVVVANHLGWLDGPFMAVFAPRPLHALTKSEEFAGRTGLLLRASGQIPVDRFSADPRAVRTAIRVLRDQGVVGVFPEGNRGAGDLEINHGGAAYLALTTGAWVQPMIFLGTRDHGAPLNSIPAAGTRMSIDYGAPFQVGAQAWPRRRPDVESVAERIRDELKTVLDRAQRRTGMTTAGPVGPALAEETT